MRPALSVLAREPACATPQAVASVRLHIGQMRQNLRQSEFVFFR